MRRKNLPTRDAEAFRSFVQGRALFNFYLGSGHGEELQRARDQFAKAAARDSEFDIARLYLAAVQTELREPDAAIPNLEKLIGRNRYLAEAHIQLAYAHIKRYRDVDYASAEKELEKAADAVRSGKRKDLVDLVEAYRVFLLAVRGGRGTGDLAERKRYLSDAVRAGQELLERSQDQKGTTDEKLTIQFEAENALGIAYMWLGELLPAEAESTSYWTKSEDHF